MSQSDEPEKPRRAKFRHTRELVNIALNDGMTQEEIGRSCRVQQSVVSKWKSGKAKAFEDQVTELLRRYGARLNRSTSRVYLVRDQTPPKVPWEETPVGQQLGELARDVATFVDQLPRPSANRPGSPPSKEYEGQLQSLNERGQALRKAIAPAGVGVGTNGLQDLIDQLTELARQRHNERHKLVQVEGRIVFRYTFYEPTFRPARRDGIDYARCPVARWLLHKVASDRFVMVHQSRRRMDNGEASRWRQQLTTVATSDLRTSTPTIDRLPVYSSPFLDSPADAGRWEAQIIGPMTLDELLTRTDAYLRNPDRLHSPHDERVLPFLLRKALVEIGQPVPGVERITALG